MSPWVLRLLVANIALYFVTATLPELFRALALVPTAIHLRPWTLVTYMFLHAGIAHLLFNMIGLFFFGPRLEDRLGGRGFLLLYFLSGLGGAVFSFIFAPAAAVVGASGAVFGILIAFAYYWPREDIYIWGVLPIQARWLAFGLIGISLYSGIAGSEAPIAHFAHLGGIAFGFGYLKAREWRRKGRKKKTLEKLRPDLTRLRKGKDLERWESTIPVESLHELNREEVEHLLEKAHSSGVESLSSEERAFLDRMTRR